MDSEPLTDAEIANLLEGALDGFTIKGKVTVRLLDEVTRARALLRDCGQALRGNPEWDDLRDRIAALIGK